MKNIYLTMQKILKSKYIGYILIFILTVVIMAPMFTVDLTQNNDAKIHLARILSIDSVIKEGVFPPIIDIDYMNGFGYALNLFYGPLTTYIPIILFNIFGGAMADGTSKKKICVVTDFISATICFALAMMLNNPAVGLIVVMANALLACVNAFNSPTYKAIIREVIKKEA